MVKGLGIDYRGFFYAHALIFLPLIFNVLQFIQKKKRNKFVSKKKFIYLCCVNMTNQSKPKTMHVKITTTKNREALIFVTWQHRPMTSGYGHWDLHYEIDFDGESFVSYARTNNHRFVDELNNMRDDLDITPKMINEFIHNELFDQEFAAIAGWVDDVIDEKEAN